MDIRLLPQKFSNDLPEQVKIGPITFCVEQVHCPTAKDPEGNEIPVYGLINFKKALITIDEELAPAVKWQCFYHEVIHAMYETIGLGNGEDGPGESEVDALAYLMLSFLMDNGYLVDDGGFPAPESRLRSSVFPYPHTKEKK